MESAPVEDGEPREVARDIREDSSSGSVSGKSRKVFFETKSLAEVYAQQGHVSTALEIYRRIRQRCPSDQQAADRLEELEARLNPRKGIRPKPDTSNQGDSDT